MHPAFSVIFFTTASGAGFGLFAWMGLLALTSNLPYRTSALVALLVGAVFAIVGLSSSVLHLGQPLRAWRAFSQWRSSWLSREGVVAVVCFLPAAWLAMGVLGAPMDHQAMSGDRLYALNEWPVLVNTGMRVAGALLFALAMATVICTAMIYASLKPVPAWTHPLVVPVYLLFSLFSGALLLCAVISLRGGDLPGFVGPALAVGAVALCGLKLRAWHFIDHERGPVSRNSALGLPHARPVHVFERPHTEANYLLKEMGYVLARKHARKLRAIATVLFAVVPALLAVLAWLLPQFNGAAAFWLLAFVSVLAGALVERWLFFAEARHLVTLYY